jgi:hypothetical protein
MAALEQRRLARRKAIRVTAAVLSVTFLTAAIAFAALYRWPISYEVGTVNGTDVVSREDLEKIIDEAAATWNRAAGRTVAWRVPLGKRVKFDIEVEESLQKYLTTLAGLEQVEAAFLADRDVAIENLSNVSKPVKTGGVIDWSTLIPWTFKDGHWGFLDVETAKQITSAATADWSKAYDRVQAFREAAVYTEEPEDIDAGVIRTEGSPTTIVLTCHANTYTWIAVVVHQFGHVLLGTWGPHDSPSSVTAAPLKSPWKLHLFGATGQ